MIDCWHHYRIKPKPWDGRPVTWFETKMDGFRVTFFKQEDGSLRAFGREVAAHLELTDKLKHWEWFFKVRDGLPPRSSLDCEMYVPGQPATKVANALVEQKEYLHLCAFAMPVFAGKDMQSEPIEIVKDLIRAMGISQPIRQRWTPEHTEDSLRRRAMDRGLEGYVLKTSHYEDNTWWKVKKVSTADFVVTGIQPGKGKFSGMCGALILSLRDKPGGQLTEVGKCSGMTDIERAKIHHHVHVGKVCEVAFQEVGVNGKLVQPRFYRWRTDKSDYWCTIDQILTRKEIE